MLGYICYNLSNMKGSRERAEPEMQVSSGLKLKRNKDPKNERTFFRQTTDGLNR